MGSWAISKSSVPQARNLWFLFPLSLKSSSNDAFFRSKRGIGWKDHHLDKIWQCFHSNIDVLTFKNIKKKMKTRDRENKNKRQKEPQILRHTIFWKNPSFKKPSWKCRGKKFKLLKINWIKPHCCSAGRIQFLVCQNFFIRRRNSIINSNLSIQHFF